MDTIKLAATNSVINVAHQLLHTLNEDSKELSELLALLRQEREVLEQNQADQLGDLSQAKNRLTQSLQLRNNTRVAMLEKQGFSPQQNSWKPAIKQLETAAGIPLIGLWMDVESQLKSCAELTSINEKIIANMRQNVNQLMNTLRGEVGGGETYSADGKSKAFASNKPFTRA